MCASTDPARVRIPCTRRVEAPGQREPANFAEIGLEGIDSDCATLIRTFVIVLTLGALVYATGKWQNPWAIPAKSGTFLVLSALCAVLLLGEHLSPREWIGITLVGGGVLLLSLHR